MEELTDCVIFSGQRLPGKVLQRDQVQSFLQKSVSLLDSFMVDQWDRKSIKPWDHSSTAYILSDVVISPLFSRWGKS